jgi:thymidylate synthase (FAD)
MNNVEPEVYLIGETMFREENFNKYMERLGVSFCPSQYSDGENIVEVMGRICYSSYDKSLNPNLTQTRKDEYIENIIKSGHHSVLEHATSNWIFHNVSRVFTAELIRHRFIAISERSLRFVRLSDIGFWCPPGLPDKMKDFFLQEFRDASDLQREMAEVFGLDNMPFSDKKVATSAMRRLAPMGLATAIGVTFNHRSLRHIIQLRTSKHAEIEMRVIFNMVAQIAQSEWPSIYSDFRRNDEGEWSNI